MPVRCEICGKGPQFGNSVSHSKKATKRRWMPNIQRVAIPDGNTTKRVNICTRCLRTLHKS